jgi:hypothetical protein
MTGTDYTGSCKSNYRTITTTTAQQHNIKKYKKTTKKNLNNEVEINHAETA